MRTSSLPFRPASLFLLVFSAIMAAKPFSPNTKYMSDVTVHYSNRPPQPTRTLDDRPPDTAAGASAATRPGIGTPPKSPLHRSPANGAFDFNRTLMAPPGTRVLIHEKRVSRQGSRPSTAISPRGAPTASGATSRKDSNFALSSTISASKPLAANRPIT
jgi:hypothetical protein